MCFAKVTILTIKLKYFIIELFGHVAAFYSILLVCVLCTVQSETVCTIHIPSGLNNMWPHGQTVQ